MSARSIFASFDVGGKGLEEIKSTDTASANALCRIIDVLNCFWEASAQTVVKTFESGQCVSFVSLDRSGERAESQGRLKSLWVVSLY